MNNHYQKLIVSISILLCISKLTADDNPCPIELFVILTNVGQQETVTITLEPLGPVWNQDYELITTGYDPITISEDENVTSPTMGCDWIGNPGGYNCVTDLHPDGYGIFPYGYFEVTSSRHSEYFYLDTRDNDYPYSISGYGQNDAAIKDDGTHFYRDAGVPDYPDEVNTEISNGEEVGMWIMWEKEQNPPTPSRDRLQPTDPSNLSIMPFGPFPKHPKLTWTRSEPTDETKYNVWRKEEQSQWHEIASNLTTNSYLDEEVDIFGMGPQSTFYYKVRAVSGDGTKESNGYSNTESIMGVGPAERINISSQVIPNDFSLTTFPNPFNPTIKIAYTIPKEGKVSLLVYDIVGRGVSTLVSEYQLEGNYIMNWDAEDFPSGIYYIRLENAGSGITRKVLLVR